MDRRVPFTRRRRSDSDAFLRLRSLGCISPCLKRVYRSVKDLLGRLRSLLEGYGRRN